MSVANVTAALNTLYGPVRVRILGIEEHVGPYPFGSDLLARVRVIGTGGFAGLVYSPGVEICAPVDRLAARVRRSGQFGYRLSGSPNLAGFRVRRVERRLAL